MNDETYRANFNILLRTWRDNLPIPPPEPYWWSFWMNKYDHAAVRDAILRVSNKTNLTTDSAGRAVSAILRSDVRLGIIEDEIARGEGE
jgi:hypothetical protein